MVFNNDESVLWYMALKAIMNESPEWVIEYWYFGKAEMATSDSAVKPNIKPPQGARKRCLIIFSVSLGFTGSILYDQVKIVLTFGKFDD